MGVSNHIAASIGTLAPLDKGRVGEGRIGPPAMRVFFVLSHSFTPGVACVQARRRALSRPAVAKCEAAAAHLSELANHCVHLHGPLVPQLFVLVSVSSIRGVCVFARARAACMLLCLRACVCLCDVRAYACACACACLCACACACACMRAWVCPDLTCIH